MFKKTIDPYENVVDFIGAAIESSEIQQMLFELVKLPYNIRRNTINKIVTAMRNQNDSIEFIQIMEMMADKKILESMNCVIKEILNTNPHPINIDSISENSKSFAILMGLMTTL